ncbi:ribonuclease HI [Novosphingobium sp. Leaf2]|nr:ribonuclease HI [Novosphingobium sp. Leaf2]
MEAAVVLRGKTHLFDNLGSGNNADAEWLALICALEVSESALLLGAEFIGDALPVIRHANTILQSGIASDARSERFLALAELVKPSRIRWIKREQNLAGIALAARHPR